MSVLLRSGGTTATSDVDTCTLDRAHADYGTCILCGRACTSAAGDRCAASSVLCGGDAVGVDDTRLFWRGPAGVLLSSPKTGGASSTLLAAPNPPITGALAMDEAFLYRVAASDDAASITRLMKSGGTEETLAEWPGPSVHGRSWTLALDDAHVFLLSRGPLSTLYRIPKAGGQTETVLTPQGTPKLGPAVDDGGIYWVEEGDQVYRADKTASTPAEASPIASGTAFSDLALGASHIYLSAAATSEILEAPKAGGPTKTFAAGQNSPRHLVADERDLYWITQGDGVVSLVRCAQDHCTEPQVMARCVGPLGPIFVDASGVYMVSGDMTIRVPK